MSHKTLQFKIFISDYSLLLVLQQCINIQGAALFCNKDISRALYEHEINYQQEIVKLRVKLVGF